MAFISWISETILKTNCARLTCLSHRLSGPGSSDREHVTKYICYFTFSGTVYAKQWLSRRHFFCISGCVQCKCATHTWISCHRARGQE